MKLKRWGLILAILMIFMQGFFLVGCKKNDWELVRSITIITNGAQKTFSSGKTNRFGAPISITEEEYSKNRINRDLDNRDDEKVNVLSIYEVSAITKGGTSYSYQEPLLKGYWYDRVFRPDAYEKLTYKKKPYIETNYSLVYVKIINDTTLKVKTSKNETTYTVTSYSIKE